MHTPKRLKYIHTHTHTYLTHLQEKVANDPNVKAAVLISAKPDNFRLNII